MSGIKIPFLFFLLAGFISCSEEKSEDDIAIPSGSLDNASWILGNWAHQNEAETTVESWSKLNDSTFIGSTAYLHDTDTLNTEYIELIKRNGTLLYKPKVSNQNNGEAVTFQLIKQDGDEMVFEDSLHDFPQRISYRLIRQDSILAEISGQINGRSKTISFPFHRID
jgi:hypothetical protein